MSYYLMYGLVVESELSLALPEIPATCPDVCVELGSFSWEDVWRHDNGGSVIGSGVKGLMRFIVAEGTSVRLAIEDPEALDTVRNMVAGAIMAIVLWQRGYLVLHASAVARDGHAVAFVAESGWGKSTTAEFLCQQGYHLVTDDVLAINMSTDQALIVPGYPRIKLRERAAKWLRHDYETMSGVTDKRHSEWDNAFQSENLPLRDVYFLQQDPSERTAAIPMCLHDAVKEAIRHTRVLHLFTHSEYRARHLALCARLLRSVSYARLDRRKSLADLGEIQSVIEERAGAVLSL